MDGSRSAGASRYRSLGGEPVDESLFGLSQSEKMKNSHMRKSVTGPLPVGSVVLSNDALDKIIEGSVIKTEAQIYEERERAQKIREEKEKVARARKLRMKELEILAQAKAVKSDVEVEEMAKNAAIRQLAAEKVDNNNDVVKMLTSLATRAVTFTLRDQQKIEKHAQEEKEAEYGKRMDLVMEIDRLRDLQRREDEERYKKEKRIKDRKVIVEQMEFREKIKVLQAEQREQENTSMRTLMGKYKEEDARKAALHREEVARSKDEFVRSNAEFINRKKEVKIREKKEVEDILIYQALKDAELKKREDEEADELKRKNELQKKLLDQQERAQDNAGKLDEIQARRAAEERERKMRQRDREDAEKKKKSLDELMDARSRQAADRKRRDDAEKAKVADEIQQGIDMRLKLKLREDEEAAYKARMNEQHRINLHNQIEEIEKTRAMNRGNNLDEGTRFRQELIREEAKCSAIRDKMVRDLEKKGVNPAYLGEMKNVNILKLINR